jgi:hypothetical protein
MLTHLASFPAGHQIEVSKKTIKMRPPLEREPPLLPANYLD